MSYSINQRNKPNVNMSNPWLLKVNIFHKVGVNELVFAINRVTAPWREMTDNQLPPTSHIEIVLLSAFQTNIKLIRLLFSQLSVIIIQKAHIIFQLRQHGFIRSNEQEIIDKPNYRGLKWRLDDGRKNPFFKLPKIQITQREWENGTLRNSTHLPKILIVKVNKKRWKVPANGFQNWGSGKKIRHHESSYNDFFAFYKRSEIAG